MTFQILFVVALLLGSSLCLEKSFLGNSDEVTSLPGLHFKLHFKHYSGYLESVNNSQLHYWFFESQNDPANDPVVLWLNGGPGCSSLLGALTENGPIQLNRDGTLSPNVYAWNQRTNVIFLETPAGVGFSYNLNQDYKTGDNATAILNYQALQSFYKKFPQYSENEFYIAGESYGGVYIPTLSVKVLEGKLENGKPKNFKGFAIGNGYLEQTMLANSLLHFTYFHGLYGKPLWDAMVSACCQGVSPLEKCDFVNSQDANCIAQVTNVQNKLNESPLNWYNIYASCDHSAGLASSSIKLTPDQVVRRFVRKNLLKHANQNGLKDDPPCVNLEFVADYLNLKTVRNALHVSSQSEDWSPCSDAVGNNYTNEYTTLTKVVRHLLDNGIKGLIYNGDVDTVCNFLGDQWFSENLGYPVKQEYSPWLLNKQVAGYYSIYENFGYTTIRGSGHTVPTDKPEVALAMFNTFLDDVKNGNF